VAEGPILFVSYAGGTGGAERILLDVASGLAEPVVLLCPEGPLAQRARAAGLPVLARPARSLELRGGPRMRAAAAAGLAAHAREIAVAAGALRPRAVVAWNMRSLLAATAALGRRRGGPPLVFEHCDLTPGGVVGALVRRAAARADVVIALSRTIAAGLDAAGGLGERLAVAEPGVDVSRFEAPAPTVEPPRALLLGALVRWKRPDLALEAIALAARELPALRLVVAGHAVDGAAADFLAALRARVAADDLAGRVEFAGALDDPRPALGAASCLLHCADEEPFGLVVLEAMAGGRPVVAPAAGGPEEILAAGGGVTYAPGDAAAAARALVRVLGDETEARRLGAEGRARVAAAFDLPAARARWRAAIARVLPERPRRAAGEDLALVTVTHDSEPELRRLLASVERHLPRAQVVVVDAGSGDGSPATARAWEGRATVLGLENVGYGRAANAGVAAAGRPACVVLNPDVELVDESLAALGAEALRAGAPERLLAPLVLRPDGARQDSVHAEPVSPASALTALVPPAALPGPVRRRVQPWRAAGPRPVAWAVGCCLAARTATLARLGPFDERIFLYAEDLELGLRARDAGVATWWWPAARVVHHEAHASRRAFGGEPFELLARQRRAVVGERRGARAARADDLLQLTTFAGRVALKRALRRPAERERRQLAALLRARAAPARL
jgi:GT2 family glycosyltransferase/glycosyltransferase involved in cell wall biosynthesis